MITRKDLPFLAEMLQNAKPETSQDITCWQKMCISIAKDLKKDNVFFDQDAFLATVFSQNLLNNL